MRQIVYLVVLVGALCFVDSVRSDELVRTKRSWIPSIFGGASQEAETKQTAAAVAPLPVIPTNLANLAQYPIYRVHRYNGVQLVPMPYRVPHPANALQPNSQKATPAVVADHRQPNGGIVSINGPVVSSAQNYYPVAAFPQNIQPAAQIPQINQPVASTAQISQPIAPQAHQPTASPIPSGIPANLMELAREYGITDMSQLPSLDEVGNLLGATTPEETIEMIKEMAATEDGRNLIRSFVGGQSSSEDNEEAGSENVETIVEPETQQNSTENLEESESVLIQRYVDSLGAVANQDAVVVPTPVSEVVASPAPIASDDVEATTPYPGHMSRIYQWANFLNPFALRQEIEIPQIQADLSQTNAVKAAPTIATPTPTINQKQSVSHQTGPIQSSQQPAPLPQNTGLGQSVPQFPAIRYHNGQAFLVPNVVKPNGQYVRINVPVAGYQPQFVVDPSYLKGVPNKLQLSPTPQAAQVNPPKQIKAVVPLPGAVTPVNVQSSHPITTNGPSSVPTQSTVNATNISPNFALPVAQPVPGFYGTLSIFQQNGQHLPLAQSTNRFAQIPNGGKNVQLPVSSAAANALQTPSQRFIQLPIVGTPNAFKTPAQHVGQLPLVNAANYDVFKNAPQLVTSYGIPELPQLSPLSNSATATAYNVSPQSAKVYNQQEYDMRPAESEMIERKVDGTIVADETTAVTIPQNDTEIVEQNLNATAVSTTTTTTITESPEVEVKTTKTTTTTPIPTTTTTATTTTTTEPVVEVTTELKLADTKTTNATTDAARAAITGDTDEANRSTTVKPVIKRVSRKRLPPSKSTESARKFIRHMPAEPSSYPRIYRAVDLMPFTVRHMLGKEQDVTDA